MCLTFQGKNDQKCILNTLNIKYTHEWVSTFIKRHVGNISITNTWFVPGSRRQEVNIGIHVYVLGHSIQCENNCKNIPRKLHK